MSAVDLSLLDARKTDDGFAVTLVSGAGLHQLEGNLDEMTRLAEVMRQVSVLAPLHEGEPVWLEAVTVGDTVVKLGFTYGGRARVLIIRG